MNATLLNAVKDFEGFRPRAYRCPAGVLTIGHGHTRGVRLGQIVTPQQAEELLKNDLATARREALQTLPPETAARLTASQLNAITDFAFNLGVARFRASTLRKLIIAQAEDKKIQDEFLRWVYAKGVRLPGLVKRARWRAMQWVGKEKG